MTIDRERLVRRGLRLNYITLGYNTLEAAGAVIAGLSAGSVALLGFGIDSVIEVVSSLAARWRLRSDMGGDTQRRTAERRSALIIGICFLLLAAYVIADSAWSLLRHEQARTSWLGIAVLALSCVIMPVLASAKHKVAKGLESNALKSDARQTDLCAYLSFIALAGVALNALFGWWWADPAAALLMTPIIIKEGTAGVRRGRR